MNRAPALAADRNSEYARQNNAGPYGELPPYRTRMKSISTALSVAFPRISCSSTQGALSRHGWLIPVTGRNRD